MKEEIPPSHAILLASIYYLSGFPTWREMQTDLFTLTMCLVFIGIPVEFISRALNNNKKVKSVKSRRNSKRKRPARPIVKATWVDFRKNENSVDLQENENSLELLYVAPSLTGDWANQKFSANTLAQHTTKRRRTEPGHSKRSVPQVCFACLLGPRVSVTNLLQQIYRMPLRNLHVCSFV